MASKTLVKVLSIAGIIALSLSGCSSSTPIDYSQTESIPNASVDEAGSAPVDITNIVLTQMSGDCADYSASYQASVKDVKRDMPFISSFEVSDDESSCTVTANDIPNYDFNDESAHFAEDVVAQNISLTIARNPQPAETSTELSLNTYNAVMLNGVVLDQVANGCYKPDDAMADENGNIANGCGPLVDWRLDPLGKVKFGTDSHNGHTQPGGLYHYHGSPNALFDPQETDKGSPVIGFAADGFPIFGPHYLDESSGEIIEATSGYTLKAGSRPTSESSPGGEYDGTYVQDYEFTGTGTLDKCNGMTVNGQYGYYVTSSYPYVMACYTGIPNNSFSKSQDIFLWVIAGSVGLMVVIALTIVLFVRRRRKFTYVKTFAATKFITGSAASSLFYNTLSTTNSKE